MYKLLFFVLLLLSIPGCSYNTAAAEKVNLVWQHANQPEVDLSTLPKLPGVNVVSPCWYDITDEQGNLTDKSVEGYVEKAHAKGYKVWPLITNKFDENLTHAILTNDEARAQVIAQLLAQAAKHHFDGINLDFEKIYEEDKHALSSFVKEISKALKKEHLVVSMDVTVPGGSPLWSGCFDRKALGEQVDYLIIMTYDQYTPSQGKSGPTASYNWDDTKMQEILTEVPATKLVLGLPLYMRLWSEDVVTGQVKGRTLSMTEAEKIITQKAVLPSYQWQWLEPERMFYFSYVENDKKYSFWQENVYSLRHKVSLVNKFALAGIASWRYGFETPDVWPMLAEKLQPVPASATAASYTDGQATVNTLATGQAETGKVAAAAGL